MRKKIAILSTAFVLVGGVVGSLIGLSGASAAVPVSRNVTVGCDLPRDNLVYVLKGTALSVIPGGCPGEDQPELQTNIVARCDRDRGNLIYTLRTRFGAVDIDVVEGGCPQL